MVQILLATYNGELYLREQIGSLLKQTEKQIEILIRDDGSTDGTLQIIQEMCQKYPEQIKWIQDEKKCGSALRNFYALLSYADADYVMFCDQDDVWFENKVATTLEAMKQEEEKSGQPLLIYSDYIPTDADLNPIVIQKKSNQIDHAKLDVNHLLVQNYVTGCTMMMNRALYENVLEYREEMLMHDWWIAIYAATFGRIMHLQEPLMYYRQHGGNCVGAVNVKSIRYIWKKLRDKETKNANRLYYRQAESFYQLYEERMRGEEREIFSQFLRLPNCKKWKRMEILIKGRYLKSTGVRILGQLWYI